MMPTNEVLRVRDHEIMDNPRVRNGVRDTILQDARARKLLLGRGGKCGLHLKLLRAATDAGHALLRLRKEGNGWKVTDDQTVKMKAFDRLSRPRAALCHFDHLRRLRAASRHPTLLLSLPSSLLTQ